MAMRESVVISLCILIALTLQNTVKAEDGPVLQTKYGALKGSHMKAKGKDTVVHSYLGIPFAKPPVGSLRLAPPQPAEKWVGVRDATKQPLMCLQDKQILEEFIANISMNIEVPDSAEDCLYLNVYTPSKPGANDKLPLPRDGVGPSRGAPCLSFGTPDEDQISIAASESGLLTSGEDDEAELPPSGVVAHTKSDSELTAILARAATGIRLEWNPPPCHVPPQYLFFQKCTRRFRSCGRHLLLPKAALLPPPLSLPSMAWLPRVTWTFHRWNMQLRCIYVHKVLPPGGIVRADAKAYSATRQAASALHTMAIL
ncbi:unnamed protein product [Leuciscus chuanchicus]